MESNDKCICESMQENNSSSEISPNTKEKKNKISFQSFALNLRRGRSLHFRYKRAKKNEDNTARGETDTSPGTSRASKKGPLWNLKFNNGKRGLKVASNEAQNCCKCTCYRRTEEHHLGAGVVFDEGGSSGSEDSIQGAQQNSENREERGENESGGDNHTVVNVELHNRHILLRSSSQR